MWKITNEKNKEYLIKFRVKLINPLMKSILYYKLKESNYSTYNAYLESKSKFLENNSDILKLVVSKKVDGIKISDCIEALIKKDISYIFNQYKIYILQTKFLDDFNYNINQESIDEHFTIIFKNFLYTKFFTYEDIWCAIDSSFSDYNRKIFHNNFREENDMAVCPYCDAAIISDGNLNIEHFLPKDKYPFLSMHPNNLISACYGCNMSEGKSTNYFIPITSPYICQVGDKIIFELDKHNKKVIISNNGNKEIKNYIKLIKLDKRYESLTIYNIVSSKGNQIFRNLWKSENVYHEKIDKILFEEYLMYKKEPLTFAAKSLFKDLSLYEDYKKATYGK